jgi:hypothetical protein
MSATTVKKAVPAKKLRPDKKGRITLGSLAKGISSFWFYTDDKGRIILEPQAEVPAYEAWVFRNPKVLAAIKQGLKESAEGKTVDLGDFTKYADDKID